MKRIGEEHIKRLYEIGISSNDSQLIKYANLLDSYLTLKKLFSSFEEDFIKILKRGKYKRIQKNLLNQGFEFFYEEFFKNRYNIVKETYVKNLRNNINLKFEIEIKKIEGEKRRIWNVNIYLEFELLSSLKKYLENKGKEEILKILGSVLNG